MTKKLLPYLPYLPLLALLTLLTLLTPLTYYGCQGQKQSVAESREQRRESYSYSPY
jgi:hypothetical protein